MSTPKDTAPTPGATTMTEDPPVTAAPTPEEVAEAHEEMMERAGRSFWRRIKHVASATWHWLVDAAVTTKDAIVSAAKHTGSAIAWTGKKGWSGLKTGGRWALWFSTGALNVVGWGLYYGTEFVITGVMFIFNGVVLVVLYTGLVVIKIVHFVALVLCTPWIALHSKQALREDWQLFLTGIKPKNLHIITRGALAAQTMREREQRAAQRAAQTGANPRAAQESKATKGRATPRRQPQRARKLPTPSPAPAQG